MKENRLYKILAKVSLVYTTGKEAGKEVTYEQGDVFLHVGDGKLLDGLGGCLDLGSESASMFNTLFEKVRIDSPDVRSVLEAHILQAQKENK